MIKAIKRLINRIRGAKPTMAKKHYPKEPLYSDYALKCERCGSPLECVNDFTGKRGCTNSKCRRQEPVKQ